MDVYIIAYIMLVYRTPCLSTPLLVDARCVVVDHATDDAGVPSLRRAVSSPGLHGRRSHSDEAAAAARPLLAGGRTARVRRVSGAGRPTARRRDDDDVRGAAACPGGVQTVAAGRRDDVGCR